MPVSSEKSLRQGKWHSRRQISDVVAAAAYTVPAVAVAIIIPEPQGTVFVLSLLAVVASGTALLFGRRAPMFSLVATASIMLITFSVPGSFAAVATALALYAVAVFGSVRQAILGLLGISTILVLAAVLLPRSMGDINQVVPAIAVLLIATLIGLNVRTRRRYVATLVDNADRLMREREHLASLAAAAERNAIAREMHDIVSHGLTVMISLAHGSAEITSSDPARAAKAMRQVAETGRVAVSDMRRMLGVLHEGKDGQRPSAVAPSPGVEELPALKELFRSAGLPVVLHMAGNPPADPGIQLVIYRVIQEALTNALKYAKAATAVTVRLQCSEQEIIVSVTDDGKPGVILAPGHLGRGLVGMRERVGLYGGTLNAGPLPTGGWSASAHFQNLKGTPWQL